MEGSGKKEGLKSALELAMERLAGKEGPVRPLTDEQREALAEEKNRVTAKIAELEIMTRESAAAARLRGDAEGAEKLEEQRVRETARLRRESETIRERIRSGKTER